MNNNPTDRLYFPELDGLRFVAFMFVFIHHLAIPEAWHAGSHWLAVTVDYVHRAGWLGVDIFFVLSAYLLTRLGLREYQTHGRLDIGQFYMRRILRIWPLYFFALFLGFIAYPAFMDIISGQGFPSSKTLHSIRDHALPFMGFLGNFSYASLRDTLGLYRSLWTISVEEQFYLILPLVLLIIPALARYKALFFMAVALAAAWLARVYMDVINLPYPWVWVHPVTRMDSFIFGIALAFLAHYRPDIRWSKWFLPLAALGLFILIGSFPPLGRSAHTIWQLGLAALFSAACLLAVTHTGWLRKTLSLGWVRYLGKISFGLYVYHRYGLDIMNRAVAKSEFLQTQLGWSMAAFAAMLLTIAISAISYKILESPFLRRKKKYTNIESRPV